MKKLVAIVLILFFTTLESHAYIMKLFDEYGKKVGECHKEGDVYTVYDLDGKKVENPDDLFKQTNLVNKQITSRTVFFRDRDGNLRKYTNWYGLSEYYGRPYYYYPNFYRDGTRFIRGNINSF